MVFAERMYYPPMPYEEPSWKDQLARWIREIRRSLDLSQAEFAEKYSVTQPTISRWEAGQDMPAGNALFELLVDSQQAGVSPLLFALGTELDPGLGKPTVTYLQGQIEQVSPSKPAALVKCVGAVQAGSWLEAITLSDEEQRDVLYQEISPFPTDKVFALEVKGPSMNEVFPEGTVIFCIKFLDLMHLGREPKNGDYVVILRSKHSLSEATVKQLEIKSDNKALAWPRSNHPGFQEPLNLTDGDHEDEEIQVWALAITMSRSLV